MGKAEGPLPVEVRPVEAPRDDGYDEPAQLESEDGREEQDGPEDLLPNDAGPEEADLAVVGDLDGKHLFQ